MQLVEAGGIAETGNRKLHETPKRCMAWRHEDLHSSLVASRIYRTGNVKEGKLIFDCIFETYFTMDIETRLFINGEVGSESSKRNYHLKRTDKLLF